MKEILQRWRFRLLLPSISSVWISPLFFTIQSDVRILLLLGGTLGVIILLIANIASGRKMALAALVVVATGALLCWASGPIFIQTSFRLFIWNHEEELNHAVQILERSESHERFNAHDTCAATMNLSAQDCETLRELMRDIGASVWKRDGSTEFELYGMLDVRWGILHCPAGNACESANRQHLADSWYRWWH